MTSLTVYVIEKTKTNCDAGSSSDSTSYRSPLRDAEAQASPVLSRLMRDRAEALRPSNIVRRGLLHKGCSYTVAKLQRPDEPPALWFVDSDLVTSECHSVTDLHATEPAVKSTTSPRSTPQLISPPGTSSSLRFECRRCPFRSRTPAARRQHEAQHHMTRRPAYDDHVRESSAMPSQRSGILLAAPSQLYSSQNDDDDAVPPEHNDSHPTSEPHASSSSERRSSSGRKAVFVCPKCRTAAFRWPSLLAEHIETAHA